MTDGLRKSHLRKAHQVGLSEVGLPDIYRQTLMDRPTQNKILIRGAPHKGRHKKKRFFLGLSPKLWVGGGQES